MRSFLRSLCLISLLWATPQLAAVPQQPPEPPASQAPSPSPRTSGEAPSETEGNLGAVSRILLGGQSIPLSTRAGDGGPLFALRPFAGRLGARLEQGPYGESWELTLGETLYVFGGESPAVVRGEDILELSQPPQIGLTGPMVPLDFLQLTFGDQLGLSFDWRPAVGMVVQRPVARELLVLPELVHLQGTTTLAIEFSDTPRYRIDEGPGWIDIEILGDRLVNEWGTPRGDALVRNVRIEPQSIRIRLAPSTATRHYVLQRPFRLVFDVYPQQQAREGGSTDRAPVRPRNREGIRTIVLDPGHGGSESGAVGASGTMEKDLTLSIARSLARRLEQRLPVRVVMTRNDDSNLSLENRTAIANQNKADLFVSLHVNSSYGASAHGAETYILSDEASDSLAADAAAAENRSGGDGGDPLYDLQLILWDLSQSHYLAESLRFATLVQEELNSALELRDRGVKQAPFRVLMGASMPAALVELGFLSNPEEEKRLQEPGYQSQLVEALVRAFTRYKALVEQSGEAEDEDFP